MNSLAFSSSFLSTSNQPPLYKIRPRSHFSPQYRSNNQCHYPSCTVGPFVQFHPSSTHDSLICATTSPEEGVVAVMNFEDLVEKDWSFLESDSTSSKEEHDRKTERIISAVNIVETSRVLVSIGSDEFVDRLVDSSPCQLLLLVHEAILSLACIKERHDKVKCWQGELIFVPEMWAPLDVVFLYFLPALPLNLMRSLKPLPVAVHQVQEW